jgi:uncharacterized protein YpmS
MIEIYKWLFILLLVLSIPAIVVFFGMLTALIFEVRDRYIDNKSNKYTKQMVVENDRLCSKPSLRR